MGGGAGGGNFCAASVASGAGGVDFAATDFVGDVVCFGGGLVLDQTNFECRISSVEFGQSARIGLGVSWGGRSVFVGRVELSRQRDSHIVRDRHTPRSLTTESR